MKVKVNIRANYYYEKDKEDVEITLKIKGDYNLANLISQFAYIKHQKNQFFYFDSYYGIEFDISKSDIYELSASDLTIEEMELIRTIYSVLDYYNVYDESNIPVKYMKLDYITFNAEF